MKLMFRRDSKKNDLRLNVLSEKKTVEKENNVKKFIQMMLIRYRKVLY